MVFGIANVSKLTKETAYITLDDLVPDYIKKIPACPAGGSYQLLISPDGSAIHAVCTYHDDPVPAP